MPTLTVALATSLLPTRSQVRARTPADEVRFPFAAVTVDFTVTHQVPPKHDAAAFVRVKTFARLQLTDEEQEKWL